MPGIIPMKLIKCGSSQTRIAQACDRCRSKKIRCDGVRPCCSQCASVGFECKTSDKLSRRAFPRGYTESLEERVRCLEREVRELKDLLDAREEQLEMMSKIHSFSPYSPPASATSSTMHRSRKSPDSTESARSGSVEGSLSDELIAIAQPAGLVNVGSGDGMYVGASSGRAFVDLLKHRLDISGRPAEDFRVDEYFLGQNIRDSALPELQPGVVKTPPRLLSDHLLVSYFQEYHPLFPVLHRPTFLASYEKLISGDGAASALPNHDIAKLFLVLSIAFQQSEARSIAEQSLFDAQWQRALEAVLTENSLNTLQCLVLAQLYCISRSDYPKLLHYKSLAVGMSLRMGINQDQRQFDLGALVNEMRKRAFWCIYCLDMFSAAMLGVPKQLASEDGDMELPADIDDEYISEEGFLPTLPGDSTKISSSLALFRVSKILAQVLEVEYSQTTRDVSYHKLQELEEELDSWKLGLAPHLRMEFANGAPATNVVHSRSPLLVLAYHYIRVLIHRPVVGSQRSAGAMHVLRDSSKCILQIIQLLDERKLGFSFPLNKPHLLALGGFTFLLNALDTPRESMLSKENAKLIRATLNELQRCSSSHASGFRSVASSVVSLGEETTAPKSPDSAVSPLTQHPASNIPTPSPTRRTSSASAKIHRNTGFYENPRRSSHDFGGMHGSGNLTRMTSEAIPTIGRSRSLHHLVPQPHAKPGVAAHGGRHSIPYDASGGLEFGWGLDGQQGMQASISAHPVAASTDDWERMLAIIDASHAAHIYGDGNAASLIQSAISLPTTRSRDDYDARPLTAGEVYPGPASMRSFDSLSDGSEEIAPPPPTTYADDNGLQDMLGPMMPNSQPILVDDTWTIV